MVAGWFVEELDGNGPPPGLLDLVHALGMQLPSATVPRPEISDDDDDDDDDHDHDDEQP